MAYDVIFNTIYGVLRFVKGILFQMVYIIYYAKYAKKLSNWRKNRKKLDFLIIFAIIRAQRECCIDL